jgi:hypothetical protein
MICPYCNKVFEIKSALLVHLALSHNEERASTSASE